MTEDSATLIPILDKTTRSFTEFYHNILRRIVYLVSNCDFFFKYDLHRFHSFF